MFNWLVTLWRRIEGLFHRGQSPQIYHRSNLHGRHR